MFLPYPRLKSRGNFKSRNIKSRGNIKIVAILKAVAINETFN